MYNGDIIHFKYGIKRDFHDQTECEMLSGRSRREAGRADLLGMAVVTYIFGKRWLTVTPPGLTLSKDRTLECQFLAFLI